MMKYSSMERYTMKKTQDQGFREYDGIITSGKLMQKAGSPTALLPSRAPPAPSLQCPQRSSWAPLLSQQQPEFPQQGGRAELYSLGCGQEDKQADNAVLQCAEVLQGEGADGHVRAHTCQP